MTISSNVRKAGPFSGNDTTTVFYFTFKVFAAENLHIVKYDSETELEEVLELDVDYTVTLNADQNDSPGGSITLPSALATGFTLTITSALDYLQPVDLTNAGGFYPTVINDALDRETILIQQIKEEVDRTLKIAVSTPDGVSTTLPTPSANQVIGWDNTGESLKNFDANEFASVVSYGTAVADIFTGDGSTTSFTLSFDPANINNLDVSAGGVSQLPGTDYTWTSGTALTFTTAPPNGVKVLARYMRGLAQGSVDWGSITGSQFLSNQVYISSDTTITDAVHVLEGGGYIVAAGVTLTINAPFTAGLYQVFSGSGSVLFGSGSVVEVYPEWWGAKGDGVTNSTSAITSAYTACPTYGTIKLGAGVYLGHLQILRDYITIKGAGIDVTTLKVPDGATVVRTYEGGGSGSGVPSVLELSNGNQGNAADTRTGINILDLTVDGNRANCPETTGMHDIFGHGIFMTKTSNCVIRVKAINCWLSGVIAAINSNYNHIDCTAYNCGFSAYHPWQGVDFNSSKYNVCNAIVTNCNYGTRILDNCWGNICNFTVENATVTGFNSGNQTGNVSHSNEVTVIVKGGCSANGVVVGKMMYNNKFNFIVQGVTGYAMLVDTSIDAYSPYNNEISLNSTGCATKTYVGYGNNNRVQIQTYNDGTGQSAAAVYLLEEFGSNNTITANIVSNLASHQQRGVKCQSGSAGNKIYIDNYTGSYDAFSDSGANTLNSSGYGTWSNMSLSGSWVNSYGAPTPPASYIKLGDVVYLRGIIKSGTGTITTLPAGYRPANNCDIIFYVGSNNGAGLSVLMITSAGVLTHSLGSTAEVNLNGCYFTVLS